MSDNKSPLYPLRPFCCPCGKLSFGGEFNDIRCVDCIFKQDVKKWQARAELEKGDE